MGDVVVEEALEVVEGAVLWGGGGGRGRVWGASALGSVERDAAAETGARWGGGIRVLRTGERETRRGMGTDLVLAGGGHWDGDWGRGGGRRVNGRNKLHWTGGEHTGSGWRGG